MATKLENLSALFSNLRTRTIIFATIGILFLVILVGVFGFRRSNQQAQTEASLQGARNIQSVPGITPATPEYAQVQQELNTQNYEQATKTEGSAIPTVIGRKPPGEDMTFPGETTVQTPPAPPPKPQPEPQRKEQEQIAALQKQLQQLSEQQNQQQVQQAQNSMQQETQQLLTAWSGSGGVSVQQYVEGTYEEVVAEKTAATAAAAASAPQPVIIKAGEIAFGVLTTEVNSDEPGPVMATLVSGPLKGGKVIGGLAKAGTLPGTNGPTQVTLNFTTLSLPRLPNSVSVSAVAIDADTARTALASKVDHHYMMRYGSLFASAFLQGYGQAIQQAGATVTTNVFGGTTTQYGQLTGIQEIAAGFGQVGQAWGNQLGDVLNRQNTVIVHSGLGVGILFLSDVTLNQPPVVPTVVKPATAPTVVTTSPPSTTTTTVVNTTTPTGAATVLP